MGKRKWSPTSDQTTEPRGAPALIMPSCSAPQCSSCVQCPPLTHMHVTGLPLLPQADHHGSASLHSPCQRGKAVEKERGEKKGARNL